MIKIVVVGALGRMGKGIVEEVVLCKGTSLVGAVDLPSSGQIGNDIGGLTGIGKTDVLLCGKLEECIDDCDVIIDFTNPEYTMSNLDVAKKYKKKIVVGTTGLTDDQKNKIKELGETNACVFAPNMSVGVNVLFKVVGEVAKLLGDDFDIEIMETHHRFKKDAPSGTALALAEVIAESIGRDLKKEAVYGREGFVGERTQKEIGIHAIRSGDVAGEHTISYGTLGERIEITHKAHSRKTFFRGAVQAALFLGNKETGLYE